MTGPVPPQGAGESAAERPARHRGRRSRASLVDRRPTRRRVALGGFVLLAAVVAAAALAAIRYLPLLDDAQALPVTLERVADRVSAKGMDLDRATLEAATADVADADARLGRIRDALRGDPLVALARALPPTGEQVRAGDGLVSAATDAMTAAHHALVIGETYVGIREAQASETGKGSAMASLVQLMDASTGRASDAETHLVAARAAVGRVPSSGLLGPLAHAREVMLDRLDRYLPLLAAYTRADGVLPALLGANGPRRYLVLAEDPAELRPTGGFIGTYGIVAFDGGRIASRTFHDVYTLDRKKGLPYVEPPPALRGHLLGAFPWQLADANWSPDFPASAEQALRFYTAESGDTAPAGVIGLTTYAIDRLLEVTGPVTVPGYGVTVSAGSTTSIALQQTRDAPAAGGERKAFLGAFASAVIDRVLALPPSRWPDLLGRVDAIREGRQAAVWLADATAQRLVADAGWDGSVRATDGDYLMPVDADVAPASKYAMITDRALAMNVAIDAVGNAEDTLAVSWTNHLGDAIGARYPWIRTASTTDAYGSFFRAVVPARSRIVSASGGSFGRVSGPETVETVAGRTAFGAYVMVPPGRAELSMRWISPYAAAVEPDGTAVYRLTIQKQMGTLADPIELTIMLPPGARVLSASPGLTVKGRVATLSARLSADLQVELRYAVG